MTNKKQANKLISWFGVLALLMGILLASLSGHAAAAAAAAKTKINFDHVKTGFPLSGAHAQIACETCHIQGTFKGTPKKCETCHRAGSRIPTTSVKPAGHIPTTQTCDTCHTSTSSWKVVRFSHVGVTKNQCRTCHNNNIVEGKKTNHVPTNLPCDACHRTTTWSNTGFDHAGVAMGTCNTCHGGNFVGMASKPSGHPATSASCDTCHAGFVSFAGMSGSFNHAGVTPHTCANSGCHTAGGSGLQKTKDHIPTNLACDYCHNSTASFKSHNFTHASTQGVAPNQCSACHDGTHTSSNALGKSNGHPTTSASCDSCHTGYASFTGVNPHNGVVASAGTCANSGCHTPGGAGKQKTSDHVPTTLSCNLCHNMTTFNPSSFTHTAAQGVAPNQCSACHDGTHTSSNALGKSNGHPTTSASCDSCHSGYVSFALSTTAIHANVTPGSCANSGCHAPGGAGKTKQSAPTTHIPTNLSCDACHNMTTFTPSSFNHSAAQGVVSGQCATCHGGSYQVAKSKPTSGHVSTTLSCDTCHNTTTFKPSTFNHSATQGVTPTNCISCHNGTVTNAKSMTSAGSHIPTGSAACSACHTATAPDFTPSTFKHLATQNVVIGQCSACHNGSYPTVLSKNPTTHIPTTLSCDACHNSTSFATSTFTHAATQGVVPNQCSNCHSGAYAQSANALGKPTTHPITSSSCDACHSGYVTFANANFHAGVIASAGTCANSGCHAPGGAGLPKPSNHIPTNLTCNLCHNMVTFKPSTFTHSAVQGVLPNQCSTCHNGSYPAARSKPSNHIPYESQLAGGAGLNCDSCHKSTTSFTGAAMNHNNSVGSGSGWCKGCHMSGTTFLGAMDKKPLNHYERYQGEVDCSSSGCHRPLGTRGTPYTRWTN